MKNSKIKELKSKIQGIKQAFKEEKSHYFLANKIKIKKESKELHKFFLKEEKKMIEFYEKLIVQ